MQSDKKSLCNQQQMFDFDDFDYFVNKTRQEFDDPYQNLIVKLPSLEKINIIQDLVTNISPENECETVNKIVLIIETYPTDIISRDIYTRSIGYALTNRECLKSIAQFLGNSKTFEIGAGSGFLTLVLKSYCNIDITATDKDQNSIWIRFQECQVFDVSIDKYPSDVNALVVSWPKMYLESLMKNLPDTIKRIVIIGNDDGITDCLCEADGGVYANEMDHEGTTVYPFHCVNINTNFPSFNGIDDSLFFYERND